MEEVLLFDFPSDLTLSLSLNDSESPVNPVELVGERESRKERGRSSLLPLELSSEDRIGVVIGGSDISESYMLFL